MKLKLQVLKSLLLETIANIDAGNSNRSEEELEEIIQVLTKLNRGIHRISKAYACEHILYCSSSTFDNYIKLGIIPKGRKEYGFKELSWRESDFDEATMLKVRKYRNKQGII